MLSGLAPPTPIAELKADTLSALKSDIAHNTLDVKAMEPPAIDVETVDDFELCRAVKEKGKPTGQYEVLPPTKAIRDFGLAGWDTLFLQFKDRATGKQIFFKSLYSKTLCLRILLCGIVIQFVTLTS